MTYSKQKLPLQFQPIHILQLFFISLIFFLGHCKIQKNHNQLLAASLTNNYPFYFLTKGLGTCSAI